MNPNGGSSYQSPRNSVLRRLDSTRNVRHGSVVIERNEVLTSMDPSKDPLRKVQAEGLFLNLTSRTNDTITVEWTYCPSQSWMPIDHFLLEHSSVTNPDFIHVKLASNERQYVLRNCTEGTNNFFVISSIDVYGKVILRSKQLTVQSSAPIDRPTLKLKKNSPNCITIEWGRPTEYGDGFISEYHLKVDGKFYTNIRSTKTSFDFIECRPMESYTFRIQALSIKHDCNSEWSNVLDVSCPAALPITLKRLRPKTINSVKVGWNIPTCKGGARVKEFRVYYKEISSYEMYNDQVKSDPDKIFGHRHSILHTHKPDETECSIKVDPNKQFWAILKADIIPEGCPAVTTKAVRVRATIKPVAPQIKLHVYGKQERLEANREIAILLDKQDKLKRRKDLLHSSDIVRGAQLKNDEIQELNVMLYQMEQRMQELVRVVNKLTGFVPVVLKWETPEFDEFSEPTSFRINVDDHSHQDPLPLDYTEHSLKLGVEKESYTVSVTTLSWHPVGHSDQSNVEVVSAKEFRPNRFFCYFTSHGKSASWPNKGGCRLEDFLSCEKKLTHKNTVHRGLLKIPVAPKPFRVLGIHDATWQSLIRYFGAKKSTIILFWTKWCISSQNMLEYFSNFAHQSKEKYQYLACCVKSGEDVHSHRKSVIELLNEKKLRVRGNIRHCCACHPAPDMPNNTVEKMENASIPASFDLAGVPTFVVLDVKGRLSWQGRVAADNDETFYNYMSHVMSQVEEHECPNKQCQHCKDEERVTFKPKEDGEDGQKEKGKESENINNDSVASIKLSLDEFHLLHSRLHGKALEEAEKTQDEQYAKLGSLSPRKDWLERRRANAQKNRLGNTTELNKSKVRFVEVSGEGPQEQSDGNPSPTGNQTNGDFRSYQYRRPDRGYRSPNNGYDRPQYGYGGTTSAFWRNKSKVDTPGETIDDHNDKPRRSGNKYSSINYHESDVMPAGDPEGEVQKQSVENYISKNKHTLIGYQSSKSIPQWNSAIKANNISRDTTRGSPLSNSWPSSRSDPQEDEIFDFMQPSHLRGTTEKNTMQLNKNGTNGAYPEILNKGSNRHGGCYSSTPDLRKENLNLRPYSYTRPSAHGSTEESDKPRATKSGKKKHKYSHIQSRYSADIYKPQNPYRRLAISANKSNRSLQSQSCGKKSSRGYSRYERNAASPS